jgi:hypothetical protein
MSHLVSAKESSLNMVKQLSIQKPALILKKFLIFLEDSFLPGP